LKCGLTTQLPATAGKKKALVEQQLDEGKDRNPTKGTIMNDDINVEEVPFLERLFISDISFIARKLGMDVVDVFVKLIADEPLTTTTVTR
jgi:hypothetical protein